MLDSVPQNLFSGNTISGTPTAAGVTNVVLTAANGTLPNDAKTLVITIVPATPPAPVFASAPTATPNPALVGKPVAFSALATGTAPISYAWSYGDTKSDVGANVSHPFVPKGTYTVTVTATDANNLTASSTLMVTVNAITGGTPDAGPGVLTGEIDSDGDGFSDAVEIAAGSDPNDPNSAPGGGAAPILAKLNSAKIKITPAKGKKPSIVKLDGSIHVPAGFVFSGKVMVADVGGFAVGHTLGTKNLPGKDQFTLKVKTKKKVVFEQDSIYSVTLLNPPATVTTNSPVLIVIGGTVFTSK